MRGQFSCVTASQRAQGIAAGERANVTDGAQWPAHATRARRGHPAAPGARSGAPGHEPRYPFASDLGDRHRASSPDRPARRTSKAGSEDYEPERAAADSGRETDAPVDADLQGPARP